LEVTCSGPSWISARVRSHCLLAADSLITSTGINVIGLLTGNQRPAAIRPAFLGALQPFKNQISVETMPTRNFRNRRMRRNSLSDDPLSLLETP
jgi:hypothetical protein